MFKIIIKSTGSMTQTWEAYTIPTNKSSLPILYLYILCIHGFEVVYLSKFL